MWLLLTHRPGQFPVQFILSPASRYLAHPQPHPRFAPTSHLQPSFLLALNPRQLAFLPLADPHPRLELQPSKAPHRER